MVDFLSDLGDALGGPNSGTITSTYRSQAQQDKLIAQGATQTQHSAHTDGNAFDYVPKDGSTPSDIDQALTNFGFPGSHILDETKPGQGTGPHYHVSNPKFNGAFLPGASPQAPANPTSTAVAASSGTAPSANDPLNPFLTSPKVSALVQQSNDAISKARDIIESTDAQISENDKAHVAQMADSVAKQTAVTQDQDQANAELQAKAAPLFAQRAALAQRRVELSNMSSIHKAFAGIFNSNYDEGAIDEKDKALAQQLGELGDEYQFSTSQRDSKMKNIQVRQSGADAIAGLTAASQADDKNAATDTVHVAAEQLSNAMTGIQAGTALTSAQVQARSVALSQATPGMLNTALAQAKQNGGTAMVGGVPLSTEEITSRQQALEGQDLELQTAKLAHTAQLQNVQDAAEQRLIAHMSDGDVATANANGGMYHGHQLNMGLLTARTAAGQQRVGLMGEAAMTNMDGSTYTGTIDRLNNQTQDTMRRMAGITGVGLSGPYKDAVSGMVAASQSWKQKIDAAPEALKPQLRTMAAQDLGKHYAGLGDAVDATIQGMTKNKDAQILLGGWAKGIPVTGEAATRGLIGLFAGGNGLPKGINMSGPSGKMFAAAQAAYNGVVQANGGPQNTADILAGKGRVSKDEFNRQVMSAVTQAGGGAWNNSLYAGLFPQIPAMAKSAGHPAGQINPADLSAANHVGDTTAKDLMGQRLGWNPDQVEQVFGQGGSKAAGYAAMAAKGGKAAQIPYGQASSMLQMDSNTSMLRALDSSPSARPGFQPSHALTDFMNSAQYASQMSKYGSALPHQDFGSFVGDAISNGTIPSLMGSHGQGLYRAVGAIGAQDQKSLRDRLTMYQNDPVKRAGVILSAIPGMNGSDQNMLLTALKSGVTPGSSVADSTNQYMSGGLITSSSVGDQIDSQVMHGKFQDPKLEALRKRAAQHWQDFSQHSDSIVEKLFKSVF